MLCRLLSHASDKDFLSLGPAVVHHRQLDPTELDKLIHSKQAPLSLY